MPVSKALVARRGGTDFADSDCQNGATNSCASALPTEQVTQEELLSTITNRPSNATPAGIRKKMIAVKWKDLPNDPPVRVEVLPASKDDDDDHVGGGDDDDKQPAACRSPTPSFSLTLLELEQHILKQEASIRRACELELKLLNQCTRVREKRSLMVQRLRKMKRKMQKLANDDKWTASKYSVPPEYESGPSKMPLMIDMTEAGVMEGAESAS